jgi:PAS domain S-box-containing protein
VGDRADILNDLDVWKAIFQLTTRVSIKAKDGNYIYRNPAAQEWDANRVLKFEYEAAVRSSERYALAGSPSIDRLEEEIWSDGSTTWARVSRIPVENRSRQVIGVATIATDVSASKRISDGYQVAAEGAGDGLFWRNLDTGETWFAPRWKEIIGYRDHELPNSRDEWRNRIHEDDLPRVEREILELIEGRTKVYECVYRMRNKKDEYLDIRARGKVVLRDGHRFFAGSHTDITADKAKEKLYDHILETIPCLVWVKDADLRFRYVNPEMAALFGMSAERFDDLTDEAIDENPEHVKKFQADDRRVLQTGGRLEIDEERLNTVKGERILATRKRRIESFRAHGDLRPHVLGAAIDITESREQVLEAKKRLDDLLQWMPDGIFFKDVDGRFLVVSKALAELAGCTPEELEGKTDAEVFGEEFFRASLEEEREIAQTGEARLNVVRRVHTKARGVQMRLVNKVPIVDPVSGRIKYIIGISKDLTHQTPFYDLLDSVFGLDQLSFCIFIKDATLTYERCNSAFAKRHLLEPEEVKGLTDFNFWPKSVAEKYRAADTKVLTSNQVLGPYLEEQVLNGENRTIETWKVPLRNADGAAIKVLGIYQDVTERVHKEAEQLAVHVGHCFKDHSFLFQNKLEKLGQTYPAIKESHEFAATMRSAGYLAQMAEMIPQLHSFQKGRGSQIYPVFDVIEEVVGLVEDARIETRNFCGDERVRGSRNALFNAILALLDNARRHLPTANGSIVIQSDILNGHIRVRVWDNGEGIREERDRIFEPFRSSSPMHTGIGLAWVKRVSEHHGGRVTLADPGAEGVDSWSHFIMELPIEMGEFQL